MNSAATDRSFQKNAMASFVQIGALLLLLILCFKIISPFITVVVWAMIIAVALYPAHLALASKLGGRDTTSAVVFVLVGLTILIVPTYLTAGSSITALSTLGNGLQEGTISVAPPDESVADWPIIGKRVYSGWTEAAVNLSAMFIHFHKQSKFIIDLTNNEISSIESCGEQKYNQLMFQEDGNSNTNIKSLQTIVN